MATARTIKHPRRLYGTSMLEVLVTIVILSFGLLGLAGLQARAHQLEFEAYQRNQALILLQDMVARIHANKPAAGCYVLTTGTGSPWLGTGGAAPASCTAYGTTATQAIADADLVAWEEALLGAAASAGGQDSGAMIGARGCISQDGATGIYTVSVAWAGLSPTAAPEDACGQGAYGPDDRVRRLVSYSFKLANLN